MLIPATSVGRDIKRTSKSSRPTVVDTKWRAPRRHEKGRRCCKDAQCAVDAEGTSVSDMPRDAEGRKPGTFAIVGTLLVASQTASRLQGRPSTRLLARS